MVLRNWLAGVSRGTWVALVVALALLAAAADLARRSLAPPSAAQPHFVEVSNNAYLLPRPDALADFKLVKHDRTPFANETLRGNWSFVFFGYTSCPDFCPSTLALFSEVHKLLAAQPDGARDVRFVMVTVDPERDTPELLNAYVPQFNRDFIGVTGDPAVIARLADSVGAVYSKVPGGSEAGYLIDHSSAVLLVNPQGRLQGVFAAPHVAAEIVRGFAKIRDRSSPGAPAHAVAPADATPAVTVSSR